MQKNANWGLLMQKKDLLYIKLYKKLYTAGFLY